MSHLTTGTQIVASTGIASDGTTRAYTQQEEVTASSALLDLLLKVADEQSVEVIPAKIATVDAFYQETEALMALWRNQDFRQSIWKPPLCMLSQQAVMSRVYGLVILLIAY